MSVKMKLFQPDGAAEQPLLPAGSNGEASVVVTVKSGGKTWRYVGGSACIGSATGISLLRYLEALSQAVPATLCSVSTGALLQAGLDITLPRRIVYKIHNFQRHYAIPEFLSLWQIYLNLPDGHWAKEMILTILCTLAGSTIVIKTSTIACQRMIDIKESRKKYGAERRLNVIGDSTKRADRTCTQLFKAVIGAGFMIGSYWVGGWGKTLFNVGAFAVGHAASAVAHRLFNAKKQQLEEQLLNQLATDPNFSIPRNLKTLRLISKISFVLGKNFWGMLVVFNHPAAYATIGLIIGCAKSAELGEFQQMTTIGPEAELTPNQRKALRTLNGLLLAGTHAFVIQQMVVAEGIIDIVSLASFLLGGYTGYGITTYTNRRFDPSTNDKLTNTVEFYTTEHTDWLPLIFLCITGQLEIDDTALGGLDLVDKFLAAVAYFSLGMAVGNDQAMPYGDHERFASTYDASIGRLLLQRFKGRLD